MAVVFKDRMGNTKRLSHFDGESIASVLGRNHIPTTSVITTLNEIPITEDAIIDPECDYIVKLIEGYDIETIVSGVFTPASVGQYHKRRLLFDVDGSLITENATLSCGDVVEMVEDNIEFTISNYGMIEENETVLVGLSGGVDSSSLLIALSKLSKKLNFTVVAATFEDFDSLSSPTFTNAQKLAT